MLTFPLLYEKGWRNNAYLGGRPSWPSSFLAYLKIRLRSSTMFCYSKHRNQLNIKQHHEIEPRCLESKSKPLTAMYKQMTVIRCPKIRTPTITHAEMVSKSIMLSGVVKTDATAFWQTAIHWKTRQNITYLSYRKKKKTITFTNSYEE